MTPGQKHMTSSSGQKRGVKKIYTLKLAFFSNNFKKIDKINLFYNLIHIFR